MRACWIYRQDRSGEERADNQLQGLYKLPMHYSLVPQALKFAGHLAS